MAIGKSPEIKTQFPFSSFSPDRNQKIRAIGEMRTLGEVSPAEIHHSRGSETVALKNIGTLARTEEAPVATFDAGGHVDFDDVRISKRRGGLSLRGILGLASIVGAALAAVAIEKGGEIGALALGASKVGALLAGVGSVVVAAPALAVAGLAGSALVLAVMLTWRRGRRSLRKAFL